MKRNIVLAAISLVVAGLCMTAASWADSPAELATGQADLVAVDTDADDAEEEATEVKGSEKKGKYYFKKVCKECHGRGADGGEVTPISKTIKQWERFFKKGIHYEEEPVDSLAGAEELLHIRTFVVAHAADSDQPETCK